MQRLHRRLRLPTPYQWQGARLTAFLTALIMTAPLVMTGPVLASKDDEALWSALRSGDHLVLMRHALAPGTGDPAGFTLGDCDTQRTLSDQGREQARRIGDRFRANGIAAAGVYASQWCRSFETAELLALGSVQALPSLNSFFQAYDRRESQTRALRNWIAEQALSRPLVLVTHQVNITSLADVYPASGEMVVLHRSESGALSVVGTLETD